MALFGSKTSKDEDKKAKPAAKKPAAAKTAAAKPAAKEAAPAASMKDLYAETPKTAAKTKGGAVKYAASSRFLVKPLITEKAAHLSEANKYVFVVDRKANKIEVAKAVQSIYGVSPIDVNIINLKGKKVNRGRIRGQRKDWKKAIVTLKKGETIKIYEGV